MRVARVRPAPMLEVDLEGDELGEWLTGEYALEGDSWLRLNLISAIGGQITGPSGGSDDLADGIDRPLLKVLRGMADVVLIGAASLRAEGYTLPRRAPLAVATASGDLTGHALPDEVDPGRLLVLCPAPAIERVRGTVGDRATIVPLPTDPREDPASALAALHDRGLRRIVCEGGGALASALIAAGLVTEFCHSSAPVISSPGAPLIVGDVPLTTARLDLLLLDGTDRTYARWALPPFVRREAR